MKYACARRRHWKMIQNGLADRINNRLSGAGIGIKVEPVSRNRCCALTGSDCGVVDQHWPAKETENVRIGEKLRKIACVHLGGRDGQQNVFAPLETIAFVVKKEKAP